MKRYDESLVDCEVCDRSHAPNHPHITNIDGDEPIDYEEPEQRKPDAVIALPPSQDELPDWLRDKPGSRAIRPSSSTDAVDPSKLCQLCGKPWAPKHACTGAPDPGTDFDRPGEVSPRERYEHGLPTMRQRAKCEVCGKVKRSNHNCKGKPTVIQLPASSEPAQGEAATPPCPRCEVLGRLCIRHGGMYDEYDTPKPERQTPKPTVDPEVAAMGDIVEVMEKLSQRQRERVMAYIKSRFEEVE